LAQTDRCGDLGEKGKSLGKLGEGRGSRRDPAYRRWHVMGQKGPIIETTLLPSSVYPRRGTSFFMKVSMAAV
jgi:hypothetical protein